MDVTNQAEARAAQRMSGARLGVEEYPDAVAKAVRPKTAPVLGQLYSRICALAERGNNLSVEINGAADALLGPQPEQGAEATLASRPVDGALGDIFSRVDVLEEIMEGLERAAHRLTRANLA